MPTKNNDMKATERFTTAIKQHLDEKAKNDADFAKRYANPTKTIEGCTKFIYSEVSKMGVNMMADYEVYEIADRYYNLNDAEIAACEPAQDTIIPSVDMTSDEQKIVREIEAKRVAKKPDESPNQLSLF